MHFDFIFKFLKTLSRNNNREWFEKHKAKYLEVKASFEEFVALLLPEMIAFDNSLVGQDPKKLVFRIYRDVRFSKDKTPYKTHVSAGFSAAGKGVAKPGYYLQLEPGNKSYIAIGLYTPSPEDVVKIRQEIDYNGDKLEKIFKEKKFKAYFKTFWDGDQLKTAPKGYAKDHPHVAWLKLKSFLVLHEFKDSEVMDKKFMKKLLDVMKASAPFKTFLSEAIID